MQIYKTNKKYSCPPPPPLPNPGFAPDVCKLHNYIIRMYFPNMFYIFFVCHELFLHLGCLNSTINGPPRIQNNTRNYYPRRSIRSKLISVKLIYSYLCRGTYIKTKQLTHLEGNTQSALK